MCLFNDFKSCLPSNFKPLPCPFFEFILAYNIERKNSMFYENKLGKEKEEVYGKA